MRLLLAEDDASVREALVEILRQNRYEVDAVGDGRTAWECLKAGRYDGAVLDIMMPGMDGLSVLRRVREGGGTLPVLLLSARDGVEDKVAGLDSGANDYLTKPFEARELLARIRAMTRDRSAPDTLVLRMGNLVLDRAGYALSSPSGCLQLTHKEYQVMELLLCNPRQTIPAERFLERIWGYDGDAEINVVRVYMSLLRKKLAFLHADVRIKALRGVGYCMERAM